MRWKPRRIFTDVFNPLSLLLYVHLLSIQILPLRRVVTMSASLNGSNWSLTAAWVWQDLTQLCWSDDGCECVNAGCGHLAISVWLLSGAVGFWSKTSLCPALSDMQGKSLKETVINIFTVVVNQKGAKMRWNNWWYHSSGECSKWFLMSCNCWIELTIWSTVRHRFKLTIRLFCVYSWLHCHCLPVATKSANANKWIFFFSRSRWKYKMWAMQEEKGNELCFSGERVRQGSS